MKKSSILVAVIALSLGGSAFAEEAQEIWQARCKGCHGDDGKAQTKVGQKEKIDDMSSPAWQDKHSDEHIQKIITDGSEKNSKMKAFKEKLTAAEILSLVKYIRTLKAK